MSNATIISTLQAYADYLNVSNLVSDGLRWIGWQIILGLSIVSDAIANMFTSAYQIVDFWNYQGVVDFVATYQTVIFSLATLAVTWAGVMFIHNRKVDYHEKGNNVLVALLLFFGLTFFMTQATQLVNSGVAAGIGQKTPAVMLFQENIVDVYNIDKSDWKIKKSKPKLPKNKNLIENMDDIKLLNINENVDTGGFFGGSEVSKDGKAILTHQLSQSGDSYELKNMKGIFKLDSYYYRFSWHPWYLFFNIVLLILTNLFVIFKVIKIELEIGFISVLTQGIALTDIDSGKRNRQLIGKLRDSFIVLFLLSVIIQFYTLFLNYLGTVDTNPVVKIIAMIAALLFVIDGPNVIQSIFGIDAGLSSMAQSATNVMMLGRGSAGTVGKLAKGTGKVAGAAGRTALNIGAGTAGAAKGIANHFPKVNAPNMPGSKAETPGKDVPKDEPQDAKKQGDQATNPVDNKPNSAAGAKPASSPSTEEAPHLAPLMNEQPNDTMPDDSGVVQPEMPTTEPDSTKQVEPIESKNVEAEQPNIPSKDKKVETIEQSRSTDTLGTLARSKVASVKANISSSRTVVDMKRSFQIGENTTKPRTKFNSKE